MHSVLIRYKSLPIYLIAPVFVWTGRPLNALVTLMLVAVLISALEETWILALLEEYDMNTKSAWHARRQRASRS